MTLDDALVRYLTQWLQKSGYQRDYEHARAEAEGFVNWYQDKTHIRIPDSDWPSPGYLTPEPDLTGSEYRAGE